MSSEEGNAVAKDRRALDALYRVSSLAGNSEDPEIALEGIIDEVMRTFNAGSASIALINADSDQLLIEGVGGQKSYQLPLTV